MWKPATCVTRTRLLSVPPNEIAAPDGLRHDFWQIEAHNFGSCFCAVCHGKRNLSWSVEGHSQGLRWGRCVCLYHTLFSTLPASLRSIMDLACMYANEKSSSGWHDSLLVLWTRDVQLFLLLSVLQAFVSKKIHIGYFFAEDNVQQKYSVSMLWVYRRERFHRIHASAYKYMRVWGCVKTVSTFVCARWLLKTTKNTTAKRYLSAAQARRLVRLTFS